MKAQPKAQIFNADGTLADDEDDILHDGQRMRLSWVDRQTVTDEQAADAAYRASIRDLNAWRGNPHSEPDTVADADSEAAAYRRSVRDLNAWRNHP